ncbi:hypothetical protein EASAB2608_00906 [Streptomyces sp. EAS-AB2608]|uniref:Uncharacterized protein n=1 Tax=Streptomyces bangladeshensis TaxID=295352 RepID=A0ABP5N944_9ACTN|nr:hypothetical protein EASAB2608_00906 [Streptomyces sp. EAS-AB2608]
MQQDPVQESAEPHSQKESGQLQTGGRGVGTGLAHGGCHRSSSRSIPRSMDHGSGCSTDSYQFPGSTAAARSAMCAVRAERYRSGAVSVRPPRVHALSRRKICPFDRAKG